MKNIERFIYVLIGIGLFVFFLTRPVENNVVVLPGDTVFTEITVYKDSLIPYEVTTTKVETLLVQGKSDTIYLPSDTVYVYNDFFKLYEYKVDTLIADASISVISKVTQNKLYQQSISAKNNRKTEVIIKQDRAFGVGGMIGVDLFAPVFTYERKNHGFGFAYNMVKPSPILLYTYKIR